MLKRLMLDFRDKAHWVAQRVTAASIYIRVIEVTTTHSPLWDRTHNPLARQCPPARRYQHFTYFLKHKSIETTIHSPSLTFRIFLSSTLIIWLYTTDSGKLTVLIKTIKTLSAPDSTRLVCNQLNVPLSQLNRPFVYFYFRWDLEFIIFLLSN